MDIMVIGTYQLYDNYGTPEAPHWKAKGAWDELLKRGPSEEILAIDIDEFNKLGMQKVINNDSCRYEFLDWMFHALDASVIEIVEDALEENPEDVEYAKFESGLPKDVWEWAMKEIEAMRKAD